MLELTPLCDDRDNPFRLKTLRRQKIFRLSTWSLFALPDDRSVAGFGEFLSLRVGQSTQGTIRILCVGPREWVAISETGGAVSENSLMRELEGRNVVAVDVSDAVASFAVYGCNTGEVLSKGCGLNFNRLGAETFNCARTRFAQIPLIIERRGEQDTFLLHLARSHENYLADWLIDAAAEF